MSLNLIERRPETDEIPQLFFAIELPKLLEELLQPCSHCISKQRSKERENLAIQQQPGTDLQRRKLLLIERTTKDLKYHRRLVAKQTIAGIQSTSIKVQNI